MTNRERYLQNATNVQQLVRLTLAVRAEIPQQYWDKLTTLFKCHPEVLETRQLTISSTELRLLWRCPIIELPRLLHLMTCQRHSTMTYQITARPPGLGDTIHLTFTVPVDPQGGHTDGQ